METKHTPEPWHVVDNNWETSTIYAAGGECVAECEITGEDTEETQAALEVAKCANARRIVACVNACAGIPTYQLFGLENEPIALGWMIDKLRTDAEILSERRKYWKKKFLLRSAEWGRVKKQRDELLGIAKSVSAFGFHEMPDGQPECSCSRCGLVREARAAIAEAT